MTLALAQINIARARYDHGAPEMAGFFDRVAAVNAIADRSPGFLWRLAEEQPGDTTLEVFGDPRLVTNMTVWESLEALENFVHRTAHAKVMARREDWFAPLARPFLALWWQDPATPPTLALGKSKLERLECLGPSPESFTFARRFEAAGAPLPTRGAAA
jgi:heme-degrading monooxygenase HmoA